MKAFLAAAAVMIVMSVAAPYVLSEFGFSSPQTGSSVRLD